MDNTENSLGIVFSKDISNLFHRMIAAMKLDLEQVLISAVGDSDESFKLLQSEVLTYRPDFLVTLGAKATQKMLGTKSRLNQIHGEHFNLVFESENETYEVKLSPLFHPEYLSINQSMKQTAWVDMQKIMESLGLV